MRFLTQAGRWCAQLFLGLFVLWQLLFLFGANFCEVAERYRKYWKDNDRVPVWLPASRRPQFQDWLNGTDRLHASLESVDRLTSRWSELTGQHERWQLFAPNVWYDVPFLAVEFRWDDGPPGQQAARDGATPRVYLLSDNEPADVNRYARFGRFRLRKYEEILSPELYVSTDKVAGQMKDIWKDRLKNQVDEEARAIKSYLRWRWDRYSAQHQELPEPTQVILHVRTYRIPAPPGPDPWTWGGPDECPMARWRPRSADSSLEVYDPVADRFDSLDE
jgi:hypothetical protein